jgi:hypothetical protein
MMDVFIHHDIHNLTICTTLKMGNTIKADAGTHFASQYLGEICHSLNFALTFVAHKHKSRTTWYRESGNISTLLPEACSCMSYSLRYRDFVLYNMPLKAYMVSASKASQPPHLNQSNILRSCMEREMVLELF